MIDLNEKEYLEHFETGGDTEIIKKHNEAFRLAIDTRKFEIELYWKRAAYFWAFNTVTFAGYVSSMKDLKGGGGDPDILPFFLSCLGFILSLGWYFTNKGSKQWQENWEHHVDQLENKIVGPLYKIELHRRKPREFWGLMDFIFTGPSKHSVSKINQLVSLYITTMWLVLVFNSCTITTWTLEITILVLTVLAAIGIVFGGRTFSGDHDYYAQMRKSTIVEKKD